MARPLCPPEEEVVRAICSPQHYDPEQRRISPSLFAGKGGVSLSRLKLIPLDQHWDLFRSELETPPARLELIGQISVGGLQRVGLDYKEGPTGKPKPTPLTVEEAPETWNPAHAEIPEPITRGLANKILAALTLHYQ
jgi:hypothetical protein